MLTDWYDCMKRWTYRTKYPSQASVCEILNDKEEGGAM